MAGLKKYAKKVGRKIVGAAKKRYVTRTGKGVRMGQVMKDVAYLKSVLNPEKKRYQHNVTDASVGQCDINNSGWYALDITPNPSQGITSVTRNGNSIKVHSAYIKYQLQAQSLSVGNPMKIRMMVIKVVGAVRPTMTDCVTTMFDPNSFVTGGSIIDYFSDRNEEAFKQFRVLRSKTIYIKGNNHTSQRQITTGSMGIKFKDHHVKFVQDGSSQVQDGQYFLLFLSDNGNRATVTPSTLVGTAETAVLTGAALQLDITQWFYDN